MKDVNLGNSKKVLFVKSLLYFLTITSSIGIFLTFFMYSSYFSATGSAINVAQNNFNVSEAVVAAIIIFLAFIFIISLLISISLYKTIIKDIKILSEVNSKITKEIEENSSRYDDELKELVMTRNVLLDKLSDNHKKLSQIKKNSV